MNALARQAHQQSLQKVQDQKGKPDKNQVIFRYHARVRNL